MLNQNVIKYLISYKILNIMLNLLVTFEVQIRCLKIYFDPTSSTVYKTYGDKGSGKGKVCLDQFCGFIVFYYGKLNSLLINFQ